MSSSSIQNDSCSYQEKLRRATGPGMYMLSTPANDCGDECNRDTPIDPYIRYQQWGPGSCAPGKAVDDGSELLGLRYKNSKCNDDAYAPGKYNAQGACTPNGNGKPRSCMTPTEDTRLSNPACTLKGTGWNRWEWLCYDPQDKAIIPFEWNTSYRIVVKDNHVPCLEEPIDQSIFYPSNKIQVNNSVKTYSSVPGSAPAPSIYSSWERTQADAIGDNFNAYPTQCKNIAQL